MIIKIYSIYKYKLLNDYLNKISNNDINSLKEIILKKSTLETKLIFNLCIKYISIDLSKNKNEKLLYELYKININGQKELEREKNKTIKYRNEYKKILSELVENSNKLNKLIKNKKKIENEFRTSIIHNKKEKKCENYIKKYSIEKSNMKSIYSLEKLKEKDINRYKKVIKNKKIHKILVCKTNKKLNEYINRDKNSVKNMIKIVSNYINTNYKPKTFVLGTKICNHTLCVI